MKWISACAELIEIAKVSFFLLLLGIVVTWLEGINPDLTNDQTHPGREINNYKLEEKRRNGERYKLDKEVNFFAQLL